MVLRSDNGDVLELPPPNQMGESVVVLNGEILDRVLYSDLDGGSVTTGDGKKFRAGDEFSQYLVGILAARRVV